MHELPFQRLDGDITFATPHLVQLRFRALQTPRDRSRIDLPHRFDNDERFRTGFKRSIVQGDEVVSGKRGMNPEVRNQETGSWILTGSYADVDFLIPQWA